MRAGLAVILLSIESGAGAQTTTIITHGFSVDSKGAWVEGMAEAIVARAGEGSIYRYTGATGAWTYVPSPFSDGSSDVMVLIFNWVPESDAPPAGPNWNYAQAAGDVLYAMLRSPIYASAPGATPADLATDRIIHFLGHSRGACVNSETARRLAAASLAVDQITTLDPHPVNGTLDSPFNFNWGDPVPQKWSNVAWADNYWRADGGGIINGLDFDGITLANTFNTQLSEAALNCCAYGFAHSDVHLWLHGTIDLAPTPCDGEECITAQMRQSWWPEGYAERGFFYSFLGGGSGQRPGGQPPGVEPGSVPSLFGGSFDSASYAGWVSHGGAVTGQVLQTSGNGFGRIGPGAGAGTGILHNRFYLDDTAGSIELDVRVTAAATGEALEVRLIREDDAAEYLLGSLAAGSASGWVVDQTVSIGSEVVRDELYQLRLSLAGPAPIEAVVDVDNIEIVPAPPTPADVNNDGCVNVDDLLVVIGSWGNCPSCAADIDRDGVVGVDDLLAVIVAWSPCGG